MDKIKFDEFSKVELKTGKIISVEPVEGSEKLIKIMVDIGEEEPRQILAGIQKWYKPEDLEGKTIIVAANLEPQKFMGLESQGMLLAADGEKPIPLTTFEDVPPGSRIR